MLTDAQLALLWQDTNTSIWIFGKFLNSAPLWELVGLWMGLMIVATLVAFILRKTYGMFHFSLRD